MLAQPTETYVAWIASLLLLGFVLAAARGAYDLSRARRLRYYQLRRQSLLRGWRLLMTSVALLIAAGFAYRFGQAAVALVSPPTLTPTPSRTPTPTPPPPTATLTPSQTRIPSRTPSPTQTLTPSATPTPSLSPTPALPLALVTPPGTLTVTPPAEAVAADIRFSLRDNCRVVNSIEYFDQVPKTIYAHFYYDSWLPGVQWSGVWLRNGEPIFVETHVWDGSTGGCGFTDYDNGKFWWPEGTYEVQIFIGDRWLVSKQFPVVRSTPTPTASPTRTRSTPPGTPTP
jgi:hypothetical protein